MNYKTFFESSVEAMLIIEDGVFVACNAAAVSMMGYDCEEELLHLSPADLSPEFQPDGSSSDEKSKEMVRRAIEEGCFRFEWEHVRKDGSGLDVEVALSAVKEDSGFQIFAIWHDVSEGKRAERALRESEARYHLLLTNQSDIMVKIDLAGHFVYVSPSYCESLGKSETELLGRHYLPFVHEDDRAATELAIESIYAPPYTAYLEHRAMTKEGWQWFSLEVTAVLGENNEVLEVVGVGRNITEKIEMEQTFRARNAEMVKSLRESEASYRQLFQNMTVGFFLLEVENGEQGSDPHYRILKVNPEAERLMRRSAQELIGQTITELFHPLESEWLAVFSDVISTGTPIAYENPVQALGMIFSTLIFIPRPGQLAVVFSDHTDQRMAEDAILQAQQQLRHVVDNITDAIFRVDLEGNCTYVNEAALRISGYSEEELLGRNLATLAAPEYVPLLMARLSDRLNGSLEETTYSFELIQREGQRVWLELSSDCVFDVEGKLVGVLSVARDISKQKELDQVIHSLAEIGNSKFRQDYFDTMVVELGAALEADFMLIGEYQAGSQPSIKTLAVGAGYEIRDNFSYPLAGTPCNNVIGGTPCSYLSEVGHLFPEDTLLEEMGIEAYVGVPLVNARQEPLGVIVALFKNPLKKVEFVESVIQSFAGRTGAEIERRVSEDEVRIARRELQRVLDGISDIIYRIDLKGNYTYVNQSAVDQLGYSYDEFMGMNLAEIVAPEYLYDLQKRVALRGAGTPLEGTTVFELICKDGHRVWLDLDATSILNEDGVVVGMAGMARNITAQKKIDQLVGTLSKVGTVKFGQEFFEAMVVELGQALGADYLFIGECQGEDRESIKTVAVGRHGALSSNFEFELPGTPCETVLNGTESVFFAEDMAKRYPQSSLLSELGAGSYLGVPLLDAQQNPLGIMVALFSASLKDIEFAESVLKSFAGRTAAELMRLHQSVELRRLSAAIDQSADTIVITDPKGIIQYVNPAFSASSGYSREEAIGQNPSVLKSGQHTTAFYSDMWKTLNAGEVWHGRIVNKRKDGSLYTEEATFSAVRNAADEIVNFVAVKRDITKELALEEQYKQSQKMESIGRLAGGVAHDFNNILQSILGFSGMLLSELDPESSQYEDVSEIRNAARRAGDLTRQLLLVSRKQGVKFSILDLNEVVKNSEKMMMRLLGEKINFISNLQTPLKMIRGDVGQIEQIILNLFVNARDAMPDGGDLRVETILLLKGEQEVVCLKVSDCGCGMSAEVQEHLFEPFFTTKEVGEGTGLGLSVVYGIVEQHDAEITVSSEVGTGTTFSVCFPVAEETEKKTSAESAEKPLFSMEGGGETILVVEDDLVVRSLMVRVLESAGYKVTAAETAGKARQAWDEVDGEFELLYCDVVLPDANGVELAQEFSIRNKLLKIIFSSGYSQDCVLPEEFKRGGVRFLGKPIAPLKMLQTVREMLDESPKK